LAFAFEAPRDPTAIITMPFPGDQPREPQRNTARCPGAERLRERRQPLAHRGGLVVDDVVQAGSVVSEREHGRGGGVVQVDERGDAAAITDDRELPLAHGPDQPVVGGAVEAAVAKRDPAGVGDRLVEMTHRRVGLARHGRRGGVERIVLGLDRPALPGVAVTGEAWATNRRTPASRAAASSASVPSVRSRLVRAKLRSRLLPKRTVARAVAWWMIASGSARRTASRTARASSRSSATGCAPSACARWSFPGDLKVPITSCPWSMS
jgi:hypothetical protein